MTRFVIFCLALLAPLAASAADEGARKAAQDILTKGAALFDTRDASAMADTYTEDAELSLIIKDKDTGNYKAQDSRGRTAIERFYQDFFKDRNSGTTSKNEVEYARFVGNDLLVIHGTFTPDTKESASFPFVQVREKKGNKWLIISLQLFVDLE